MLRETWVTRSDSNIEMTLTEDVHPFSKGQKILVSRRGIRWTY